MGITAPIGAYLGVPLTYQDGAVFGTLCAIDSQPKPAAAEQDLPLIEMVAKMLSGVLSAELRAVEAERERERYATEEESDALTGLFNRAGWERMLRVEEERCRRYGGAAFILLVDLDGLTALNETRGREAGDKLIRRASKVVRKSVRDSDVVARLSGDEFGVLGTSNYPPSTEDLLRRVRKALERAGVRASLGMASRIPALELGEMWVEANQFLQSEKAARKLNARAGHLRKIYRSQVFRFEAAGKED
jgi:diguanylate cyclase (GGDEF)-like protein